MWHRIDRLCKRFVCYFYGCGYATLKGDPKDRRIWFVCLSCGHKSSVRRLPPEENIDFIE